jgi:hypothetical protein
MEEISRQVHRAGRRLFLNKLVHNLSWTFLFATIVAFVGVVIPKIWPLHVESNTWLLLCTVIPLATAVILGTVWTYVRRGGDLDAALEIDQRCGLKERVSSAIALSGDERESEAGKALLEDAERRVSRVDVSEHFRPKYGWRPLIPALVAVVAFLVAAFVEDAQRDAAEAASGTPKQQAQQVKKSAERLRKEFERREKEAAEKGLQETAAMLAQMKRVTEDLEKNEVDRKKALVKLNKLSNQLGTKRDGLAGTERMKKQLEQLKNIQRGPADRIATALKNGDLNKALDAIEQLEKKLRSEKLSEQEKEALAKQLDQLREQLQKMLAAKHNLEQQKRDIQKRIEDLKRNGDLASASKLQNKLDQVQEALDALDQQHPQLQRLQELADQLGACSECLKNGDASQAAQRMGQMAEMLRDMKAGMDQLETLDALMDQLADAKNSMNCQACNGEGCEACMGAQMAMQGAGAAQGPPGMGLGEGTGKGDRPEEEEKTGGFRSRVGAKPQAGESVRVGDAMGPNIAGASQQEVKEEIASSFSEDADPLVNRNLPRREREQAKEYFQNYRKGKSD